MTIQTINIGTVPNDGTGDSARTSFDKINQNFTDPANAAAAVVQTSPTDATAGRLMAVGAFGVGDTGIVVTDIDDVEDGTHFSFVTGTTSGDIPFNSGSGYQFSRGTTRKTQIALEDGSSPSQQMKIRNFSGTWSAWQPVYTGANLNTLSFTGNTGEFISPNGYGRTSSTANIYFPLLDYSKPVSVTIIGSFTVVTTDFVSRGTVTSADVALQGISTGKTARLDVSGLSGVGVSEPLILRAASAGSSITFNF